MAIPQSFGWKDIDLVINGNIVVEIKEISYTKSVEKQNNMGRGQKPTSRSRGNESYELTLNMSMNEVMKIRNGLGNGQDETDLAPLDIPIVYTRDDGVVVRDVLKDVEFTQAVGGASQGDLEVTHELSGICSDIEFNKTA